MIPGVVVFVLVVAVIVVYTVRDFRRWDRRYQLDLVRRRLLGLPPRRPVIK